MNVPNWLAGLFLLAVAGVLIWRLLGRRRAAQRFREQQEIINEEAAERAEKIRQGFLKRVRNWDTVHSNPLIEGRIDGVLRRFLFIPVLPGHMKWLGNLVNSGKFEPINVVAFNYRDPGHATDVQRQVDELKAGDCPVAPPKTAPHLYGISLVGPTGDGSTMDGAPHDTVAEHGFQRIPLNVTEETTHNGASSSVILQEGAFEVQATAATTADPLAETEARPERKTLAWTPKG